jgi:sugar lactone lactonase YvrE
LPHRSRNTTRRPSPRPLGLEQLECRLTPSTLIPVSNRHDLVFDPTRDLLYITTASGQVQRYDVANQRLLTPWNVGTSLNGADITPDGSALYVAENQTSGSQGVIHKVNLDDGSVTNLTYALSGGEGGSFDIAVADNGKAFFSTRFQGSGWVPFRQIDLSTGAITTRTDTPGSGFGGQVRQDTQINRGGDGSQLFMTEANISSGPIFTYDPASNSFPQHRQTNAFYDNMISSVSPDGSLIATEFGYGPSFYYGVSVMDRNFHSVRTFAPNFNGGLAFDPSRDLLYLADASADQVVAFDTNTWQERFRLSIGESIPPSATFGNGEMTVSSDGSELFLSTPFGVRMIDLPASTGVASRLAVSGFPNLIPATGGAYFTVTALDPAGNTATGYTGTVQLTSTDPGAAFYDGDTGLPLDTGSYTFQPTDQGTKTFISVLNTGGSQSITATDSDVGFSGTQVDITVHTAPTTVIPVVNHRDLVYDPFRNVIYITTTDGLVWRYDVNYQTLLAPWKVGASLNGADITPDGQYLYVTEGVRGVTQGMVHKINLDDGTVTNLTWNLSFYEGGAWGLAIANNGKALLDSKFEGSGWVPLRQIDLSTDTITARTDDPGSGGGGQVRQDTHIRRGGDRSRLFLLESNISSGPIFDYSAASDSFPTHLDTQQFLDSALASVSRDGSLVATELFNGNIQIRDRGLNLVHTLTGLTGGMVFDPTRDVLYGATSTQIIAYDTNSWTELYRFDIGQSVSSATPFGNGEMRVSDDGSWLFFSTSAGVRVYLLGGTGPGGSPHVAGPHGPASAGAGESGAPTTSTGLADLVFVLASGEQHRRGAVQIPG